MDHAILGKIIEHAILGTINEPAILGTINEHAILGTINEPEIFGAPRREDAICRARKDGANFRPATRRCLPPGAATRESAVGCARWCVVFPPSTDPGIFIRTTTTGRSCDNTTTTSTSVIV
jgi:hypothetical protein